MSGSNSTCYKEDGSVSTGNYLCGFANQNTCCGYGWDCLSNGLCRQHGTTSYAQSTCTDPNYKNCLSFCNESQFDGFTEVSRCESTGNSWCCAGAAGQGLGGTNCCDTNLTTSLEPYPFSAIDPPTQSTVDSFPLTASTPSFTESISTSSSFSQSSISSLPISETSVASSTRTSTAPSQTLTSSLSPQPTIQSHNSKTGIEIGIPVAIVVVLLAVLAFFIFQNRKFRQRLLQLRNPGEGSSPRQEETRAEMQGGDEYLAGELDVTHYELPHQNTPQHELSGNEVHEIYHYGILEHELDGNGPWRSNLL